MSLDLGVLIIGSLYWDDRKSRRDWRSNRLCMGRGWIVSSRIRYGRRSESRGCTYTMVFSLSADCAAGTARIVSCRKQIASIDDLKAEAAELWAAEDDGGQANGNIAAGWGCVGLIANPKSDCAEIVEGWVDFVGSGKYDKAPAVLDNVIDREKGLLKIPWPRLTDGREPAPLDLLLATTTVPTLLTVPPCAYASPEVIAEAWGQDTDDRVEYFRKNRQNDITTFQDREILDHLQRKFPAKIAGIPSC
jgi:hypothetical protein